MAYTRIHAVKATVHKTIAYICNPAKTEENLLVSSFATSPQTAKYDFAHALSKTAGNNPNMAFHMIQSFAPGEVSADEAHKIGTELANRLLKGEHSYVIATHVDKGHCHNHICFCAANNITHQKYYDNKKSYYRIRQLSDELCKEHNLSVIHTSHEKGMKYNEWLANRHEISWKTQLRNDIDELIKNVKSYDEFIRLLKAKGYEIKGESFGDKSAKYISFKPIGSGNYIRGREKSLGAEYTKERIRDRIMANQRENIQQKENKTKITFPFKKHKNPQEDYSKKKLIDTNSDKFQNSPGLHHWADIQNLKIAASSYSTANSIKNMKEQIEEKYKTVKISKSAVIEMEHELKQMAEILKYAEQYVDNEPFHQHYKKSKNPDNYYRTHDMQLILFDGALSMLKRYGIDPQKMNIKKMHEDYTKLISKKDELKESYKSAEKEIKDMKKNLENIEKYVGYTVELDRSECQNEPFL